MEKLFCCLLNVHKMLKHHNHASPSLASLTPYLFWQVPWIIPRQHTRCIGRVDTDCMQQQISNIVWEGFKLWHVLVVLATNVCLNDSHAVSGESSSLVRADGCCIPHGLTGIQVPHQVIVFHHFLQGEKSNIKQNEIRTKKTMM